MAIGLGIVDKVGRTHTKEVTLYDVMSLPSLKEAAKAMHRHNCNAVMELAHGGKYANARGHGQADEQYALGPNDEVNPDGLPVRQMTDADIYAAADSFAQAAKLVKEAGFDMVLIHGGHGWLLGQFMSPSMNHRTDQWGGSLENRMRFPLLVIEKVRQAVGPHFLIEYRMSGAEYTQGGYTVEEGIRMAKMLDGKVDLIHVSAGVHEDPEVFVLTHPSMFVEHGCNVFLAAEIKKHVKTPVASLAALHHDQPLVGHKVVILGGGLVGSECAIYLDGLGKEVTVVEMKDDWASDAYFMHKNAMKVYLRGSHVKIQVNTTAKAVTEDGLVCDTPEGEVLFPADTVLLAAGMKADRQAVEAFYNAAPRVFEVGDCIRAGRVVDAVSGGYWRALDV